MLTLPSIFSHNSLAGFSLALTTVGIAIFAAPLPVEARTSAPYYVAELAAPASDATVIAGGVAWTCAETKCVGTRGTSRPLRICSQLRRDVGPLVSFTFNGEAFDEASLAKCNG